MLVLSRKSGESINLGNDIKIAILSVEGDRVRIGIEAPKDIKILRTELLQEVISVNIDATNSDLSFIDIFNKK